jgi:hypothetical protein
VSEKTYYCPKCEHNHKYTSKVGMQHLQYKTSAPLESLKTPLIQDKVHPIPEQELKIPGETKRFPDKIKDFFQGYRESYTKGVEKFGIWWTIFQLSIWSFVLIFLVTAMIIVVVYLPKIEMIHWELR